MRMRASATVLFLGLLMSSSALACDYFFSHCYAPRDTFGDAFRAARDNQIMNPEAVCNVRPAKGLNGQAAAVIYDKYLNNLQKPSGGSGGGASLGGSVPLIGATTK